MLFPPRCFINKNTGYTTFRREITANLELLYAHMINIGLCLFKAKSDVGNSYKDPFKLFAYSEVHVKKTE